MAMAIESLKSFFLSTLLRRNVIANYIGSVTSMFGALISLPFYLFFLGPSQYGLIGFILLIQASLNLLDFGLGQVIIREISLYVKFPDGSQKLSRLIFNIERFYWGLGLILAIIVSAMSTFISTHWLNLGLLPIELGKFSIIGAGLIFFFQFPGIFYRSFLIATESQIELNNILFVSNIFRHIGGVFLVYLYPSIITYLFWQAFVGLCETLVRKAKTWSYLKSPNRQELWEFKYLIHFFKLTSGLSFTLWIGTIFLQLDKVIISKMAPVDEFAYYNIASAISIGVLQLIQPLIFAVQPKAVSLKDNPVLLRQLFIKLALSITLVISIIMLVYYLVGESLIGLWLRHAEATKYVYEYCSLLLIGSAFNALLSVGYLNWIIRKKIKNLLILNLSSLACTIIFLPKIINTYGLKSAPLVWVIINLVSFSFSLGWLKKSARS